MKNEKNIGEDAFLNAYGHGTVKNTVSHQSTFVNTPPAPIIHTVSTPVVQGGNTPVQNVNHSVVHSATNPNLQSNTQTGNVVNHSGLPLSQANHTSVNQNQLQNNNQDNVHSAIFIPVAQLNQMPVPVDMGWSIGGGTGGGGGGYTPPPNNDTPPPPPAPIYQDPNLGGGTGGGTDGGGGDGTIDNGYQYQEQYEDETPILDEQNYGSNLEIDESSMEQASDNFTGVQQPAQTETAAATQQTGFGEGTEIKPAADKTGFLSSLNITKQDMAIVAGVVIVALIAKAIISK